jgi:hypothetical protein
MCQGNRDSSYLVGCGILSRKCTGFPDTVMEASAALTRWAAGTTAETTKLYRWTTLQCWSRFKQINAIFYVRLQPR